jgi:hypothetical protein
MAFRPNTTCIRYAKGSTLDLYGKASYAAGVVTPCAEITFDLDVKRTSVRVDTAASRGRAEHVEGWVRLLFPKTHPVKLGDVVVSQGRWLEVMSIFPRRSVLGILDHYQVDLRQSEREGPP